LKSERNATLLIDVLRSYMAAGKFEIHDFVVMPDHIHLLPTVPGDLTIEKAIQLIKGRFSYRLKRECGYLGEVWQVGFSESRADDTASFEQHRSYIAQNPVKAGLVERPGEYPYSYAYLAAQKNAGAKAPNHFLARVLPRFSRENAPSSLAASLWRSILFSTRTNYSSARGQMSLWMCSFQWP